MQHQSVLLRESCEGLALKSGSTVVDATLGSGGHSLALWQLYGDTTKIIGFDLDGDAIERAGKLLRDAGCTPLLINESFGTLKTSLEKNGITSVDGILFDLGISSVQLDDSGRGFSFKRDEPLLMTLTDHPVDETVTAYDVVNTWDEETLHTIIKGFGEERYAGLIAKGIARARKDKKFATTFELVECIRASVPASYTRQKIHFATKTFQAIRIATNGELAVLKQTLPLALEILNPGGRIAVITFHSLEDRIVKHFFKQASIEGQAKLITKKPIVPKREEELSNSRSRSAKLRIIEKI